MPSIELRLLQPEDLGTLQVWFGSRAAGHVQIDLHVVTRNVAYLEVQDLSLLSPWD